MRMNFRKAFERITTALAAVLIVIEASVVRVYADTGWDANKAVWIKQFDDSNFVRIGGVNSLDGITAENREETEALERYLRTNGYVWIRDISADEQEVLKKYGHAIGEEYWNDTRGDYKAYVYHQTLDSIMQDYENNGTVSVHYQCELQTSTVLLEYYCFYTKERVGKIYTFEELNDNIPEVCKADAGYITIESPIDAVITLHLLENDYYYELAVHANEPMTVKIRPERYAVSAINGVALEEESEETIIGRNYFSINSEKAPNEESALKLNVENTVRKYNIKGTDLSKKPERIREFTVDRTVLDDEDKTPEEEKEQKSKVWIWITGIASGAVLIAVLVAKRKKKV